MIFDFASVRQVFVSLFLLALKILRECGGHVLPGRNYSVVLFP